MRIPTSFLCLLASVQLFAADTYRWVDKDGVVHYSDQPSPGAQRIPLNNAPLPGSVAPPAPVRPNAEPPKPFSYAGCELTSPNPDQIFNVTDAVSASLNVLPPLQIDHRVSVQLNGSRVTDWPPGSTSYLLQNLSRGSYTVVVVVTDAAGRTMCTSQPVTFHVRQPSMLTPGARNAPRS